MDGAIACMDYRAKEGFFFSPASDRKKKKVKVKRPPPFFFARPCSFNLLSSAIDLFLHLLMARTSHCWHPVGDLSQRETTAFRLLLRQFKPVFLSFWVFLQGDKIELNPALLLADF